MNDTVMLPASSTDAGNDNVIPMIIRGRIIESDLVNHFARGGDLAFRTPDVSRHVNSLVLRDPLALSDLYKLSLNDVVDYLSALAPLLDYRKNKHIAKSLELMLSANTYSREMAMALFEVLPNVLRRESVEEIIEKNIGRKYLEGWVNHQMMDREVAVRAFGARSIHVIAGNSPMVALLTVIMNAVSRGDAIIKIPSNDPYFSVALVRTMIEMAPDHPITRHVSVAYWKGGDENVERALYDARNIEKIIAWGGFAGMRRIRQYLSPGLDLIALDPKISGSIIGRLAFESPAAMQDAAAKAAADVGYQNQGACGNARTLFVETGLDKAGISNANRFGELLFEAIQALPPTMSSLHPAFDPVLRSEIDGIRYNESYKIFGGRGAEGAVIVSQDGDEVDFSERLDCRVANIVPVDNLANAMERVTVHMQTIGIYPDSLKEQLRDECALRGAQRIVSLGRALDANWAGPHDAIEPLRRMVRWLRYDSLTRDSGIILP